jgi:methyl-accepting chemotaxis protein
MKTRFESLSIQNRLFTIFSVIILLGALTAGFTITNTLQIGAQNEKLHILFGEVREIYQARGVLQRMNLAEKSYVAQSADNYLEDFNNASAQMEAFIRQALIKADNPGEKNTLITLQDTLYSHIGDFRALVPAIREESAKAEDAQNWVSIGAQQAALEVQLDSLNTKIDAIAEAKYTMFEETDERQSRLQRGALGVSIIALIFFAGLTFFTAIVLHNQVNRPSQQLLDAITAIENRQFDPAALQKLTERQAEIGQLARAVVAMAAGIQQREQALQQQADDIRAKIRQREENRLVQ